MNACTLESHAALKLDEAAFRAACEYRYEWDIGDGLLHMYRCRACQSDLSGPVHE